MELRELLIYDKKIPVCSIFYFCFILFSLMSMNASFPSVSNSENLEYSLSTQNEEGIELKLMGQAGGLTRAVTVEGKHAFVGIGMRLVVLDITNQQRINEVGSSKVLRGNVTGVVISKKTAYVSAGGAGLYIMNISNPKMPSIQGFYDSPGYPENVYVKGKYAYIADGWAGLQVVDISAAKNPKEVGSAPEIGYAFDVVVSKEVAYIATGGAGLKIVDIKNPTAPVEIGWYNTPGYAYGISFSPDKSAVFVADSWEGVQVIDVSNSSQPCFIASYKTPGWAFDVFFDKNTLYVADAFKGLRVLDVKSSSNPIEIGSYESYGHAGRVVVDGEMAYVADRSIGLRVIDISKKSKPILKGLYSPLGYAQRIAVSGNYVFVVGRSTGLRVVDASDSSRPKEVGQYDPQGVSTCVAVAGNYAYFATPVPKPCFYVVDVSNPKKPTITGSYSPPEGGGRGGYYGKLIVSDRMAYITDEIGLELIDVSNPRKPTPAGYIRLFEGCCLSGFDIDRKYAYVAARFDGIKIVDISNPKKLIVKSSFKSQSSFSLDAAVKGNKVYLADRGLRVLDISDPSLPYEIGFLYTQGGAQGIMIEGNIAYVANSGGGIAVVDASNPLQLSLLAEYHTPDSSNEVIVRNQRLFDACGYAGLLIFEFIPGGKVNYSKQPSFQKENRYHPWAKEPVTSGNRSFLSPKMSPVFTTRSADESDYNAIKTPKTWVVKQKTDRGQESLRWCMENAKKGDTIIFNTAVFPPKNPATIFLMSGLPGLSQGNITIDASNAGVILNGKKIKSDADGLMLLSDGNIIRGLQIINFPNWGIEVQGHGNIIGGESTRGSGPSGQGNMISGNAEWGIALVGSEHIVSGNLIGSNALGVFVKNCTNSRIGGTRPGERNIISGNREDGIQVQRTGCSGISIIGNYIGTDKNGKINQGNKGHGIYIEGGAFNNLIKGNLISGNGGAGINIADGPSSYNTVIGNIIGLDASGKKALRNDGGGVSVGIGGASFNRIGGVSRGERNVIGGDSDFADMELGGISGSNNIVIGNYIGTDSSGKNTISSHIGLVIGDTEHSFIGGITKEERNIICGDLYAIEVSKSDDNFIAGNYIGINPDGTSHLKKPQKGISLDIKSYSNAIFSNVISGECGFDIYGNNNNIRRNSFIGSTRGLTIFGNDNTIYQNEFLDNQTQAADHSDNFWSRNGIGNYWSDYQGTDSNGDGIGDTPYKIPPNGTDAYPLMRYSSRLKVSVNPVQGGTVMITPSKSYYAFGEIVQLTAKPKSGYAFSIWTGDCPAGMEKRNPLLLSMNKDKHLTANFVPSTEPFLSLSNRYLNFTAIKNSVKTPDQCVRVKSSGGVALPWIAIDTAEWLSCSPSNGSGDDVIYVSVNPGELAVGVYNGILYINSLNSSGGFSSQSIVVNLEVLSLENTTPPFGEWDYPYDSSSLNGGFHLSGWALDRVGVESVKIFLLKNPFDDSSYPDEICVGTACFVDGARPDIQALYQNYPLSSRAGWGYNFISNLLNADGVYRFRVVTRNVCGEEIELGRKTFYINNMTFVGLFGDLDVPLQGSKVLGKPSHFTAWLLPCGDAVASDVSIYIDSEYKKSLSSGFRRPELRFFSMSESGSRYFGYVATIDSSLLSNDYHTVFIIAEEAGGRKSVLGSRWFHKNDGIEPPEENIESKKIMRLMGLEESKIYGYICDKKKERIEYSNELFYIKVNELKNIRLQGFSTQHKDICYKALYGEQEILPLGMKLDPNKGTISWLPIPGFKGEFRIKLVKLKDFAVCDKRDIIIQVE